MAFFEGGGGVGVRVGGGVAAWRWGFGFGCGWWGRFWIGCGGEFGIRGGWRTRYAWSDCCAPVWGVDGVCFGCEGVRFLFVRRVG